MSVDPELAAQLLSVMTKARGTLAAAKDLLAHGYYNDAASRAYYAAFHALQAALLTRGLAASKHAAVLATFNKEFIRTQAVPDIPFRVLKRLLKDREEGDYRYGWDIGPEQCGLDVETAERVIAVVSALIERQGVEMG